MENVHKGRVFYFAMPDANIKIIIKKPYTKGWLDYDGQIERLRVRGLDVPDVDTAKRFLAYVNYYRFTGYCLRFQRFDDVKKDRVFNDGVCFDDIYDLYVFDRNLRDCVSEALECVEIGFRATVAYYFSKLNGAFGHLNTDRFERKFVAHPTDRFGNPMVNPDHSPKRSGYELWHDDIINETQRSNEIFINHFKQTYTEFPDLPIWVALEICSFGTLSKMFAHMLRCDMRPIATRYSLQASTLLAGINS